MNTFLACYPTFFKLSDTAFAASWNTQTHIDITYRHIQIHVYYRRPPALCLFVICWSACRRRKLEVLSSPPYCILSVWRACTSVWAMACLNSHAHTLTSLPLQRWNFRRTYDLNIHSHQNHTHALSAKTLSHISLIRLFPHNIFFIPLGR